MRRKTYQAIEVANADIRLKGDGKLHLAIYDCYGQHLWRGTFAPPEVTP